MAFVSVMRPLVNCVVRPHLLTNMFIWAETLGSLSLPVNEANQPVALLFAGGTSHTIANPVQLVLAALGITIAI